MKTNHSRSENSKADSLSGFHLPAISINERIHQRRAVLLWQAYGGSTCILNGEEHALPTGFALWIPARVHHAIEVEVDSIIHPLLFYPPPSDIALKSPALIDVDAELKLYLMALTQSQSSIIQPDIDLEAEVISRLASRFTNATSLQFPISPEAKAIARHIQDNPGDTTSIADLAITHHLSLRTVERTFLTETGMSLRSWRIHRRMEEASRLLRSSDLTLEQVSRKVGYESLSTFRRAFKRHYDVTPSSYMNRFKSTR